MTEERLSLGRRGEAAAALYLQKLGMKILHRNFQTPVGEIDLIARDRQILVFAEVKTRRSEAFGAPAEAVGLRKQRQIIRAARWYLNDNAERCLQPRFDVIAVLMHDRHLQIEHLPGAFEVCSG